MTIIAKVIQDSITSAGNRLTTLELRYPRIIHSEFMTHRVFSRNASSSRAIPVEKIIADIEADIAMPVEWGANQKGMQAHTLLSAEHSQAMERQWREAAADAITRARAMIELGAHKQIINRILEPYSHINVVVTATEWKNFFDLRDHEDADPTIRELARAIKQAMGRSSPDTLQPGRWHLPYISLDSDAGTTETLLLISAARCARVSYKTHDGRTPDPAADIKLANMLAASGHWSPFEHQAMGTDTSVWCSQYHDNFKGWLSHRRILALEQNALKKALFRPK